MDDMKGNVEQLGKLGENLEAARLELDGLNHEETLLEWEESSFPLLQSMVTSKEPYDRLWSTTLSFHLKRDHWLNGRFQNM